LWEFNFLSYQKCWRAGEEDRANLEEVVEQLLVNQGDHVKTHVSNVEVFSYTYVAAGNNNDAINGSGSLIGVHMGAIITENQEVECMKAGAGDVQFQDMEHVHVVMGENEVECVLSVGIVKENIGLGVETPYVVFHAHDVAERSAVGHGSGVCYVKANEGQCGENAAHVQVGVGEMEVEQSGPVGRKSLRQWKRRARVSQVVHGNNCKSKKALGKRQGAARLAGEGELTKKKRNAQECVVVHAAETDLVGTVV
jgi:hypothetical protein